MRAQHAVIFKPPLLVAHILTTFISTRQSGGNQAIKFPIISLTPQCQTQSKQVKQTELERQES